MKIDIETIKKVKGIGKKSYERLIEQHRIDTMPDVDYEYPDEITGLNDILHGDAPVVMRDNIPSNSIDLVVTSPPYDEIRDYNGYEFNYKDMLREIYRVLKPGGVCVWVVGDTTQYYSETGTSFRQAIFAMEYGFLLHDTMIYEKNTSSFPARPDSNKYTQIFEYMFVFSKGRPKTANLLIDKPNKWAGTTNWGKNTQRLKSGELIETSDINPVPEYSPRNNIWKYKVGGGMGTTNHEVYNHPATFPEKLAKDHILTWSNEGDIVLDPMCGSGTTCVMAKRTNRNYIGIDISKEYVELSKRRINNGRY